MLDLVNSCSTRDSKSLDIEPHKQPGVYIAHGRETLYTLNLYPSQQPVYGERFVGIKVS